MLPTGETGVPKEIAHTMALSDEPTSVPARLRTVFVTEGKTVVRLMVQLEVLYQGAWKPVRRCDDHHGAPHIDRYNAQGEQVEKQWLARDRNQALTLARDDFKANWERYVAEFMEADQP